MVLFRLICHTKKVENPSVHDFVTTSNPNTIIYGIFKDSLLELEPSPGNKKNEQFRKDFILSTIIFLIIQNQKIQIRTKNKKYYFGT